MCYRGDPVGSEARHGFTPDSLCSLPACVSLGLEHTDCRLVSVCVFTTVGICVQTNSRDITRVFCPSACFIQWIPIFVFISVLMPEFRSGFEILTAMIILSSGVWCRVVWETLAHVYELTTSIFVIKEWPKRTPTKKQVATQISLLVHYMTSYPRCNLHICTFSQQEWKSQLLLFG